MHQVVRILPPQGHGALQVAVSLAKVVVVFVVGKTCPEKRKTKNYRNLES